MDGYKQNERKVDKWRDGWTIDDDLFKNIYLTMQKAEQENVNKATPAG